MSTRKELGRISHVSFGWGGYNDGMLGISFTISMKGSGVQDFWGAWGIKRSEHAKWTEEDRITELGNIVMRIGKLFEEAKARDVCKLVGTPVEVTFDGMTLQSWRVLTEVLP